MGRALRWLAVLLLVGCGGLPTQREALTVPSDCEGPIAQAELAVDEGTPEPTLACLLHRLRPQPPTVAHARICALLADQRPPGASRERLASEGVRAAEAVLKSAPTDGAAHYFIALNLGIAVQDRMTLAAQNLERLRTHLEAAVARDPQVHQGGPLRVLGLLYLRAPAWPQGIGDGDKALALLKRATAHPGHPLNAIAYAQALWEVEEDAAAAEAQLARAEQALKARDWGAFAERWQRDIATLRAELPR